MKIKKILAVTMSSLMLFGGVTGCGWSSGTEGSTSDTAASSGNREDEVNQEAYQTEQDAAAGSSMTFGIQNNSGGGLDPASERSTVRGIFPDMESGNASLNSMIP